MWSLMSPCFMHELHQKCQLARTSMCWQPMQGVCVTVPQQCECSGTTAQTPWSPIVLLSVKGQYEGN